MGINKNRNKQKSDDDPWLPSSTGSIWKRTTFHSCCCIQLLSATTSDSLETADSLRAQWHAGIEAHWNLAPGDLEISPLVKITEQLRLDHRRKRELPPTRLSRSRGGVPTDTLAEMAICKQTTLFHLSEMSSFTSFANSMDVAFGISRHTKLHTVVNHKEFQSGLITIYQPQRLVTNSNHMGH